MTLPLFLSKWQTGTKDNRILMQISANWKNALKTLRMYLSSRVICDWIFFLNLWVNSQVLWANDLSYSRWIQVRSTHEYLRVVSVQSRALLISIFMEIILLIGGKNCVSARKVSILRKTKRVVAPSSLSGVKGIPTWEATSGMVSTLWAHIEKL